jgi:hypothetical protein
MDNDATATDALAASMAAGSQLSDPVKVLGNYRYEFTDAGGNILRVEESKNVVCTLGKNAMLNSFFAGSAYTAAVYMGLISTASWSAVVAADSMSSHAGWLEGGATNVPHYTAPRPTAVFAAASGGSIALSGACSFVFTGSGTVEGAFVVGGAGATSTIDNTSGILISENTIAAPQPVISTNTLNVSASWTLT